MASPAAPLITRFEIPDPPPTAAVKPPDAKLAAKEPTAEERIAALERDRDEARESAKVWEGIANARGHAAPKKDDAPVADATAGIDWGKDDDITEEPDDVAPEALIDDLSKTGIKALAKHGFVRKSDVVRIAREESRKAAATASRQVVNHARQEFTTQDRIMQEFPELGDRNSEFFKIAAEHVREAVALDPAAAKNPTTLYLAAKAAKAQLAGKRVGRTDDEPDEDDPPRPARRTAPRANEEHDEHVRAQQGDRGRTRSRVESGDDEIVLSSEQSELARRMGLTDDEYKAHAQKPRPTQPRRSR